jgi:hypothetical protein
MGHRVHLPGNIRGGRVPDPDNLNGRDVTSKGEIMNLKYQQWAVKNQSI